MPDAKLCPTGHELRDHYLLPLAGSLGGAIQADTQVVSIGHEDGGGSQPARFRLLARGAGGGERVDNADVVLDCSGTYAHHRWAGRGGVPAPGERGLESRIWYQLPDVLAKDKHRFLGKHTLILGAGYSAATILQNLAHLHRENPRTKVSWAIRRIGQAMQAIHNDLLPARASLVKMSIELANNPPAWLQYLGNCVLEEIEADAQFGVTLKYMETDLSLVVDEVVALVGYGPDASIYEPLQVPGTAAPLKRPDAAVVGGMTADDVLASQMLLNPTPGFFILGAKSYGTNSNFLLQVGHKQIRDAFRVLANDPNLDLYATR
jgi:hypothetical protein